MNALPRRLYLKPRFSKPVVDDTPDHAARIRQELLALGASQYGVLRMGSRYLPQIIHEDEPIKGIVYGWQPIGSVMLVATDRRVIFLDKKPLFINKDEITYDVVSGVNYSHGGFGSQVILHTRIKDYAIHCLNERCAANFVKYIEVRCLEHQNGNGAKNAFPR